jgi:pimeloyl-ACP methyl ester carboxylesterase
MDTSSSLKRGSNKEITPFRVEIPESDIQDLRDRLKRTRWPDAETVDDWSQGIPLSYTREICSYWATEYDWRRFEAKLNSYEQGITNIDGLDIHFIHARSSEPTAKALLFLHGWPGSVVEHLDNIEAFRDPTKFGGRPDDAYHVIIPSLPGYGFSGRPTSPGWNVEKIGATWVELMSRLGYDQFLVQGGDWGAIIATHMGHAQTDAVAGIHINFTLCSPEKLFELGEPTEFEQQQISGLQEYMEWGVGYAQIQGTRPQTLGYGLTDSPVGQCAWIYEKFNAWVDHDGATGDVIPRDTVLDNISLYWFTATAVSSGRLYWESVKTALADFTPVKVPTAYSCFPKEITTVSERWARTRFPELRHYGAPARGGHFPALEQPALFVAEVRDGLRAVR